MLARTATLLALLAGPAVAGEWEYVVTVKGQPAAGVRVGMTPYSYPTPGKPEPGPVTFATSDAAGKVRFPDLPTGGYARLLARDAAGRCGYGNRFNNQNYPPTLDLHEPANLTGRVTDADGKPIPGLMLTPIALGPDNYALPNYGGRMVVAADTPAWFWEKHPTVVSTDGSFVVRGGPAGFLVQVRFAAPGFGTGTFWALPGKPATIPLAKAGAAVVRFLAAGGGQVKLTLDRQPDQPNPYFLEATADGTVPADGELVLALPPGTYQVRFPATDPAALFPKPVPPVVIRSGERVPVMVSLEPPATITAVLVDSKTGA